MKEKKQTTQDVNPDVVKPEENATTIENNEVVGVENQDLNPDTIKPEENAATIENNEVAVVGYQGGNLDSVKPEENNSNEDLDPEKRILGVKIVTDDVNDIEVHEASILEPLSFVSESGENYQITVPKFRFRGQEYESQKAIDEFPEVLETLIQSSTFFIKKS